MESAEAMIVFNKYDELMDLVKKYACLLNTLIRVSLWLCVVLRIKPTLNGLKELM